MKRTETDFSHPVCQPFNFPGGEHGVLLLHGFTGSAAHMRPLGEALNDAGFTVMGVNLPGHATTMEDMARMGWQDWIDAAKEAFCRLQGRCRYASVAGLSMGGCLTLLIAQQLHPTAAAVISAPMGVRHPLFRYAHLAARFMPRVMWRERNRARHPVDTRYDYGYPGFPTRNCADLRHLIDQSRRDLHAVQCPLLIVQSRADETITGDSAQIISDGVSSNRVGTLWLDDAPHACTITAAVEQIAPAIAALFREAET